MSETYRFSSDPERTRRIQALRSRMTQDGLDALIVCGRDDIRYRGRAFYVSDVWQLVADTHVVILPEGAPIFVGGQVFGLEQAELSDWIGERRINGNPGAELATVLREHGVESGTVGLVGLSDAALSAWHFSELKAGLPTASFRDATELFEAVRQVNSAETLASFADTSALMRLIYAALEPTIRPGMREIDLAAEAHRVSREHGLRDPMILLQTTPFGAIGFGTTKQIERTDVLTVWIESAGPSGYWVEYRRCYTFGAPSADTSRFWELQKEATITAGRALRPGAMASDFVRAAEDILKKGGFDFGYADVSDSHYMFSLHGIGTDAIQGVWVPGNDRVLQDSEVVNVHPTIDFRNHDDLRKYGWLGVTDNMLVTADGGQFMTHEADVRDGFIAL
jgi:Xaa-Pro aminopeptidase